MVSLAINVSAQTDSIAGKTHSLAGVEVSAHGVSADVTAAVPTQTLQGTMMQQLGMVTLSDAVKHFAGTSVRDYGGIGGMKTVSVRNLGAHHTAVSYDGITVSDTQAGQIDIARFSLDNVSEVSMVLGQSGDQMQSARHYASAGVLSVETERPHFTDKDYVLRARVRGGAFGLVSPSLRYWQRVDSTTSVSVDGSYMRADGAYPFTLVNGRERTKEKRNNSDIYSWQAEANLYHTFRDSSSMQTKAYYYYSERGLPGVVILYNNVSTERLWDENFFAQSIYDKRISKQWQLCARLKYNHSWNKYEDTNVKYDGGKQTDIDRQDEYYASATIGWKPVAHLSFSLAEDGAVNTLRNNIGESPNPVRFTSLTAVTARYHDARLLVDGNLVGTFITEHVSTGTKPDNRRRLSPSLSASYRLLADVPLFVRAMFKSTFRVPSFNDMYYLRIGNVGLRPEKALEYDAGMTWSGRLFRKLGVQLTLDGYYSAVHDKIVAFPTTYIWKMANFGRVHITGLDATLAMDIPVVRNISASLTASYTLQKAIDKTDKERESYNDQLPYTPENSGSATAMVNTPWVNIGYSLTACGERYSMGNNAAEYRMSPYAEHSVTASHEFVLRHCRLSLSASILNLTNKQYEIIQYYPMPGRNWQMSATATF